MIRKHLVGATQLLALWALAACAGDPAAPGTPASSLQSHAPNTAEVGVLMATTPLVRDAALARDITVARRIGSGGGSIRIPQLGFTLTVPRGAVARTTRFTVTALKGKAVAYEFKPHGTVFLRPLVASQHLAGIDVPSGSTLQGGYFPDRSLVDASGASALVAEFIPGSVSEDNRTFNWPIRHFSGYIVAW
ncbi:MAG: hypothetical protein IT359_08480 [Gemmatimonadaceae bacterium]|nr:hypothetical protein [Gemmatimonadaceae bacterium]